MNQEAKISELPKLTNLDPADLLAIVQSGVTGHAQLSTLLAFLADNIAGMNFPVGTFTPSLLGSSGNPSVTYGVRAGRYVRIGNLIHFELRLDWSALSGGSGNARIEMPGLANARSEEFSGQVAASWFGITLPANITSVAGRFRTGENRIDLVGSGSAQSSILTLPLSSLANSGRLALAGTYITT